MQFKIIWSAFAEKQLDEIFDYYKERANEKVAKKFIRNLIREPNILRKDPFVGQVEFLLKERKETYRYLVYKATK